MPQYINFDAATSAQYEMHLLSENLVTGTPGSRMGFQFRPTYYNWKAFPNGNGWILVQEQGAGNWKILSSLPGAPDGRYGRIIGVGPAAGLKHDGNGWYRDDANNGGAMVPAGDNSMSNALVPMGPPPAYSGGGGGITITLDQLLTGGANLYGAWLELPAFPPFKDDQGRPLPSETLVQNLTVYEQALAKRAQNVDKIKTSATVLGAIVKALNIRVGG